MNFYRIFVGANYYYVLYIGEVSSIFTLKRDSAADSPTRLKSKKHFPKKLESSPTTHVTETSFLHILDFPDHLGTIYTFDHFWPNSCLCLIKR